MMQHAHFLSLAMAKIEWKIAKNNSQKTGKTLYFNVFLLHFTNFYLSLQDSGLPVIKVYDLEDTTLTIEHKKRGFAVCKNLLKYEVLFF